MESALNQRGGFDDRRPRYSGAAAAAWLRAAAGACVLVLAGCGGSSAPPPSEGSATLDATGGEVLGPDGVKLAIPASALASATTFRIARDGTGAPELGGAKAITPVYAITPHGTAFAESARVSIPFNPADVAPGTQPVLLKAEPGGTWTALRTDVVGNTVSAADTPSLSFFAVGTCLTTRDTNIPGLDPLLYCPAAHELKLTLQDGSGANLPTPTYPSGSIRPALSITSPTVLNFTVQWTRPRGVVRADLINVALSGAGLQPSQQPLRDFSTNSNFSRVFNVALDPATVPGASASNGVIVRILASVRYTTDAFYPGCFCFRPASWTFDTEIPIRVTYRGTQPVITQQPQNQSVQEGQAASFSVAATGNAVSVQWSVTRNGSTTAIPGATGNTYVPLSTQVSDSGTQYTAQVCSARGTLAQQCINSNPATLSVTAAPVAPVFTTQPQSLAVIEGQTGSLSVVATGQPGPTVSWFEVVTPRGAPQTLVPVAACPPTAPGRGTTTAATCNLGSLSLASDGQRFVAVADNGVGQPLNSSVAQVRVGALPVAPSITSPTEPRDQTVAAGGSVSWTITATGTAVLSYQWSSIAPDGTRQSGILCAGGTSPTVALSGPTLTLSSVPQGCDGYRFQATVSNGVAPNATSRQALLAVTPATAAPQITTALAPRSVLNNAQVTFNVAATGNPAVFTYAWTLDGAAVPRVVAGCTSSDAACTFTAQLADSGKAVAVSVSNGVAPAASSNAVITVTTNDVAASITQQPTVQSGVVGGSATFTIGTAGTPTPEVVWQTLDANNNWVGTGVTGNSYTPNNLTLAQNGLQVRAVVSNAIAVPNGSQGFTVTSNPATLSVVAVLPTNALTATQVVAHADRSLVVRPDGSVWAFGRYTDPLTGGFPNTNTPARPVRVAGLPLATQVAVGSYSNSWVLGRDGTVWGWGFINSVKGFGQGPSNTRVTFASPVQVLSAAGTPIDRVCHIAGSQYGVVMVRSDVQGGTCAASEPRSVWFTGDSMATGQVGGSYATPLASLAGNGNGVGLPTGRWIVEVITSRDLYSIDNVIFARANDGTVYAWGLNGSGQLGTGNTSRRTEPTAVAGWQGATRIAVGGNVTLALMPNGSIKGAGNNNGGNLGIDTTSADVLTPTVLAAPTGASDVSVSFNYPNAMALVGGRLFYWGGGGRFSSSAQFTPIPINAPATPLTAVSVASYHALAIGPGGAVYAWGDYSALGCGNYQANICDNTRVPQLVTVP